LLSFILTFSGVASGLSQGEGGSLKRGPLIVTQAWYNRVCNCYDAEKSEPVA